MAIRDALKVSRKTFFNPRAWLGYDALKDQTETITSFIKGATTVQRPDITETYDEAMQRLDLTEADVRTTARLYLIYAISFLVLAVCDFFYGLYLLFHHGAFLGLVLSLAVFALLIAQAFRYHFWYFQIQSRKLGCTIDEWRDYLRNMIKRKSA
jgi:intracellular multiplication protein IcmV